MQILIQILIILVWKMAARFSLPLIHVGKTARRLSCSMHAAALCQTPWADLSGDCWSVHNANSAQDESWDRSLVFKNYLELLYLCFAHGQGGKP